MASHRFWRFRWTATVSSNPACSEIQFRATAGGANVATNSAKIWSDLVNPSFPASNAIDGNTSSLFAAPSGVSTTTLAYDFGSAQTILEVTLRTQTSSTAGAPSAYVIEASDDGVRWLSMGTASGLTWANAETKTFSVSSTDPAGPTNLSTMKLVGYAVGGPSTMQATKVSGYAVINSGLMLATKLTGYAVVQNTTTTARVTVVFVTT
jgi:hypothetical protein